MSFSALSKPKLRWPLDLQSVQIEGRNFIVLKDQSGVSPEPAVVPAGFAAIVGRFDGTRTVEDIAREGGLYGVTIELVIQLAQELSRMHFLETSETQARWENIVREYRASPRREAALAGLVYPEDPRELNQALEEYIGNASTITYRKLPQTNVVGLICPHIDYRRGWHTYGTAFSILKEVNRPDAIFLFGTAHQAGEGYFHLTNKEFATPLGTFPVESSVMQGLANAYGTERCFRNEILHRREHSLELQLPFLAYRYQESSLPPIIPILVGSFHECVIRDRRPSEVAEISEFIDAVAEVTKVARLSGKQFLYYGGVDLAHVGQHFGDTNRVANDGLLHIETRDKELLDCILRGDEEMLFEHIQEDKDARRICGFPSMYVMLAALRRAGVRVKGELVEYRQAVDPVTDCIVTFASACWTEA